MPRGVTGFYHYNARWIIAEQGAIAGLGKSNYINRLGEVADVPSRDLPGRGGGRSLPEAGLSTSDYIHRTEGAADDELGAHILITRNLPVDTGAGLARLLDARERKKDRTYRCYGGRLPRVGSHFIISFRYGLSAEAAAEAAWEHARMMSDRLRVPLEGRVHNKNGAPDHLHLIVGTRVVDHGKLGRKCRELDAVSEKHDGKRLVEGVLGPTIEALRADWAERMRRASGDMKIDHRSYARRGMAVYPVTHFPRSEIEYQKRRGRTDWRRERNVELQDRAAILGVGSIDQLRATAGTAVAEPAREPKRHAPDIIGSVASTDPGSVETVRQRPTPARAGPVRDGDLRGPRGHITRQVEPDLDAPTPGINATPMIAVHRALRAAHRLTASREQALAGMAGVEVEALRHASTEAVEGESDPTRGDPPLPAELARWVATWRTEDLGARAEQRRGRDASSKTAAEPSSGTAQPSRPRPHDGSVERPPDAASSKTAAPLHGSAPRPHREATTAQPSPAPDVHAGPGAVAGSDALARALWDAHADDVLARAYDRGRSPPSDDELSRSVALRLRASGYDRHETGRALRTGRSAGSPSSDVALEGALDRAFSPGATAWLDARPGHRARASRVSNRAEMDTYRRIRSAAMARLRGDLDDVWSTRRTEIDRLMARHRADMAWLRDLRWRNRRLQKYGLVLAILSILVELAFIRPLTALEKALTAHDRRELDDAAKAATERLRFLREEWRAAHGIVRDPFARRDDREQQPGGSTRGAASVAEAMGGETLQPRAKGQTPQDEKSAMTATDHQATFGSRPVARAGSMPVPSRAQKTRMREPAGEAGREATKHPKGRGRTLSSLESRLERSSRHPGTASEGSLAKATGWSALIRTIVADEPDPERQDRVIQRLVEKLVGGRVGRRGAFASDGRLATGWRVAEDLGSTDGLSTSTRSAVATGSTIHAVPPPRAAGSGAVEAPHARASASPVDADEAAHGLAQPAMPTRTDPAPSSREGQGRPSMGSKQGGADDVVAPLPSGSATAATSGRSEVRALAAATSPQRTVQQEADPEPVVSAVPSLEPPASVAPLTAADDGGEPAGSLDRPEDPRPNPGAEFRRHLVAQYALVLAASKAWSDDRKRRLAALAQVDPQNM